MKYCGMRSRWDTHGAMGLDGKWREGPRPFKNHARLLKSSSYCWFHGRCGPQKL